eukprot:5307750-Prorocentrum_lima.AAC.1
MASPPPVPGSAVRAKGVMRGSVGVIRALTGERESRGRTYGAPAVARRWERWDALRPEACDG